MSQNTLPHRFAFQARRLLLLPLIAIGILDLSTNALGDINTLNQSVWKMLYGVTDTQANDPVWKAADDDGDGISNGVEIAAGTDPFSAGSTVKVTSLAATETTVSLTFPTMQGKEYVLQAAPNLGATWAALSPTVRVTGNGASKTLSGLKSSGAFFRVLVQDLDTDGDGVSDWAERVTGYDPNAAQTNGLTNDSAALTSALATENFVTVAATGPSALQPPDALTAPINVGQITVSRTGTLLFSSIKVLLSKSGTAIEGTDYASLPAFVTIPANSRSIVLDVTPMANPALRTNRAATVNAVAGIGYTLASPSSASVVINPAGNATGTGLTANYWQSPESLYTSNFGGLASSTLALTRVDPKVDFSPYNATTNPTGWQYTSNGSSISYPISSPNSRFAVRWTGQVQPQYSETYYFVMRSDDGCTLKVNGQQIITSTGTQISGSTAANWGSHSVADTNATPIALKAGVLYDIVLEYYSNGSSAPEAHLQWYSDSQVKQVIPSARLYPHSSPLNPTLAAPTSVTSPLVAIGFVGQPFSFGITASNSASVGTTYAVASGTLPLGLNPISPSTGMITGIPTVAGSYQITVNATNPSGTGSSVVNIQIFDTGNAITREIFPGLGSGSVSDIPQPGNPQAHDDNLTSLEDIASYADNTGERLRGYITAPKSGNYYFWIAASNAAELWISNNSEPVNKLRRAYVTGPTGTASREWNLQTNQKSAWLSLIEGQKYYFEVLHNTGSVPTDHVAVGWFMDPTGSTAAPITNGSGPANGTTTGGIVPGYVLSPYDYPATAVATGTLFATNLAPQGAAATKASGTANLRLNAAKTQAILHFEYSGLTTPRTGYHVHSDPFGANPSQIIFDIDDVDSFHPELRTADGGYIWDITAVGTLSAADIVSVIESGKSYLNIHSVNYPNGEIRGNFGLVVGSQSPPVLVANPSFSDDHATDAGAARFLHQAAYGAHPTDLAYVKANGFSAWIDDQFAKPSTLLVPEVLANVGTDINQLYPSSLTYNAWWKRAVQAPDQLRQRVAFALSEIMVVSDVGPLNTNGRILADHYDTLLDNAFSNFRTLLKQVTLTPAMGIYLDMRGNQKEDLTTGRHPNENYAREIMQLFSIGLYRMWPDGSLVLDSKGALVPTYGQPEILGMARALTGWNYGQNLQANGRLPTSFSPSSNYLDPMVLVPSRHELGSKLVLDNVVLRPAVGYNFPFAATTGTEADSNQISYDTYCLNDLELAIDSIVNNPNVGPYICRQLIQRLVASNPSPEYLHRVVQKFNDDGFGVRGNLQAVVKAILLDGEARNSAAALASTTFGKQREPIVRLAALGRTFPTAGTTGTYSTDVGTAQNRLLITTTTPHDLSSGATVFLDFLGNLTQTAPPSPADNPTTTNYTVLSSPAPTLTTFAVNATGMVNATYTQAAGSNTITVATSGPAAPLSKVYLKFLSGGAPDGIYSVASNPSGSSFTVTTTESPAPVAARAGNVLIPKLGSSYSVNTTGTAPNRTTTITLNTQGNHNLVPGDHLWLDAPVAVNGVTDAEYIVSSITDEDHLKIVITPVIEPAPSNQSQNSNTIWALIPPPVGRSGTMKFEASTFNIGGTNSDLTQTVLASTTVFNFFFPDYKYPGALATNNVTTPEFQLTTDTNVVTLTNTLASAFLGTGGSNNTNTNGLCSYSNGSGKITMDLGDYQTPAWTQNAAAVTLLVDKMSALLTGGALTASTKTTIINFVANTTNFPYTSPTPTATQMRDRVRAVVHLIVTSAEYAIQK